MSWSGNDSDSDTDLKLSVHAQAALAAFLAERQAAEQVEEAALAQVESTDEGSGRYYSLSIYILMNL